MDEPWSVQGYVHRGPDYSQRFKGWKVHAHQREGIDVPVTVSLGHKEPRPEIVCLCGSSRFVDVMAVLAWELEKEGKIVVSLHLLPQWYDGLECDHQAEAEGVAEQMDELHLRKIDLSDRVMVVNVGGYIGESTAREIEYATETGKPVAYVEEGGGHGVGSEGEESKSGD